MPEADRAKWNLRYRQQEQGNPQPTAFLSEIEGLLPRAGRALDVAGGMGRNALWLAQRGLEVTLADISSEGLKIACREAAGVALESLEIDLEIEPFPVGPWDLIVCTYYLQRSLFKAFPQSLSAGGLLVYCQPTQTNLQRHSKPPAAYLLEDGELRRLVDELEIVHYDESWGREGRYEARVVARNS